MSTVLVTGATGLIGRHVVPALVARGDDVHTVGRTPAGDARHHVADLLDDAAVAAVVAEVAPTHVLHLAWTTEHGRFWSDPANLDWAAASLRLLATAAAHGCERWVGAGSCAEYALGDWPCDEATTPLEPATLYGAAKDAVRRLAEAAAGALGVRVAWGRVFFLHGPGEDPRRLVPSVVRSLLAGEEARCSPGTQVRDFLHATDVAAAFVHLLDADVDGAVNVSSGRPVAIAEVVERLGALVGRPELVRLGALPLPASDAPVVAGEPAALRAAGWAPALDLDAGLARTVEWWREAAA